MMTGLAVMIFGAALAIAGYAIVATVAPNWRRIAAVLNLHRPARFEPLATLVQAERRIAVRRWAGCAAPARLPPRSREAA